MGGAVQSCFLGDPGAADPEANGGAGGKKEEEEKKQYSWDQRRPADPARFTVSGLTPGQVGNDLFFFF